MWPWEDKMVRSRDLGVQSLVLAIHFLLAGGVTTVPRVGQKFSPCCLCNEVTQKTSANEFLC